MAITLTHAGQTAQLSDRLHWADEFSWTPVAQDAGYSITGALLVNVGLRQAGRPITLEGANTQAWLPRDVCDTLAGWAAQPGITLQLQLRGVVRDVVFDHPRGFEAKPLHPLLDGETSPQQLMLPTLRFLEV